MSEKNLPTPSLLRRLAAMFYDSWLIIALLVAVVAIMVGLRVVVEGSENIAVGQPAISGVWKLPTFLLMLLSSCHFFAYFWVKNKQTLGMQTWRMQILTDDQQSLSYKQAYLRCGYALLSLSFFGLGYWWALVDKDKKTWHDRLSKSHIVLLPKQKRPKKR